MRIAELCPITARKRKVTLESLPKSRRTLIGMPFIPKTGARELRPLGVAFEQGPLVAEAPAPPPIVIDPRSLVPAHAPEEAPSDTHIRLRPPGRAPVRSVVDTVQLRRRPRMSRGVSLLLGLAIGLVVSAVGAAASHASAIASLLG